MKVTQDAYFSIETNQYVLHSFLGFFVCNRCELQIYVYLTLDIFIYNLALSLRLICAELLLERLYNKIICCIVYNALLQ